MVFPYSPQLLLGLIPALTMYCFVLSPGSAKKGVCLGKVLPYFLMAHSPASLVLPYAILLPTILDWLCSQGLQECCAGSGPAAVLGIYLVQASGV